MKRTSKETQKNTPKGKVPHSEGSTRTRAGDLERDPYVVALGARMRDLRLEKGFSLATLRQAGGLTPSQMSSAERGRVGVTIGTLVSVARALGLPPFMLMTFPEVDAFSAVLEEIRQAFNGDLSGVAELIEKELDKQATKKRAHRPGRPPRGHAKG
jgi:transcriptional regulator with XRE-family HTH domain